MGKYGLRDLREHCSELSCFFATQFQIHVAEWLGMASGVVKVELDTTRFNPGYGWCSNADEYHYRKDVLRAEIATELAVFSFVWGSLEAFIDETLPKRDVKQQGKINAACEFLKTTFEPEPLLPFYEDLLGQFHDTLVQLPHYRHIQADFRLLPSVGISGVGLYVVYRIRNAFAHGSLVFPEPSGWDTYEPVDPELIKLSSRLVLLSTQMLAMAHCQDDTEQIEGWWRSDDTSPMSVKSFLRAAHVQELVVDTQQLPLPFESV